MGGKHTKRERAMNVPPWEAIGGGGPCKKGTGEVPRPWGKVGKPMA